MKRVFIGLSLWLSASSAFAHQSYVCSGRSVAGTVEVRLNRKPTASRPFPHYATRATLTIAGRPVRLFCSGPLSYFEREVPGGNGAWEYDESISIFSLCGSNLGFSTMGEGFHLEVGPAGVRGYLGNRDHRRGVEELSAYDFTCH